jgi:single-strand DNA-binding protein
MINKAILIGRLGKDPEVRYTPDGQMVTSFGLATDEQWKDKNGEKMQRTEWHNITAWGKLAEICGEYLKKGSLIYVEGKIQSNRYEDKDGIKRISYGITISVMKMLGGKQAQEPEGDIPADMPVDDVPYA